LIICRDNKAILPTPHPNIFVTFLELKGKRTTITLKWFVCDAMLVANNDGLAREHFIVILTHAPTLT
jgi:hypothetical protein